MEAAIRTALVTTFEEYVYGLETADTSQFPITLRNLTMKPKKVNEELEDTPFLLEDGSVGIVKVSPGWNGSVAVEASGIKVNLSFSPVKAAKLAMRPADPDYNTEEIFMTGAYAPQPPPVNVPPRYCCKHDSSAKRTKGGARECGCQTCGITFMTTYTETVLCSACSEREKRCIICGSGADKAGSYIPSSSEKQVGGNVNASEKLPPPPPGPGAAGGRSTSMPRQDPYGNLQPTESIPVKQSAPEATSMLMQGSDLNDAVAQLEGQRQGGQRQPPMRQGQQGPPFGNQRGPPPISQQQQRQRPPQRPLQENEDDNPFVQFLRGLNCGKAMGFDDDDEETAAPPPNRGRGPPRGPPPGGMPVR